MKARKLIFKLLYRTKERLWNFIDAFNDDRLALPSTGHIIKRYMDYEVDDIEEFAAIYTYDYHYERHALDNRESKKQIHAHVYKVMEQLKKSGRLDD